ncbi:hypothetical protein TURU_007161 [Turdus rufiventris]|nr:hypothetical protein TURU_007161 [Turdus rufiventris]
MGKQLSNGTGSSVEMMDGQDILALVRHRGKFKQKDKAHRTIRRTSGFEGKFLVKRKQETKFEVKVGKIFKRRGIDGTIDRTSDAGIVVYIRCPKLQNFILFLHCVAQPLGSDAAEKVMAEQHEPSSIAILALGSSSIVLWREHCYAYSSQGEILQKKKQPPDIQQALNTIGGRTT